MFERKFPTHIARRQDKSTHSLSNQVDNVRGLPDSKVAVVKISHCQEHYFHHSDHSHLSDHSHHPVLIITLIKVVI